MFSNIISTPVKVLESVSDQSELWCQGVYYLLLYLNTMKKNTIYHLVPKKLDSPNLKLRPLLDVNPKHVKTAHTHGCHHSLYGVYVAGSRVE
jgi:hypothetical protein